jgi:hypothetical protein
LLEGIFSLSLSPVFQIFTFVPPISRTRMFMQFLCGRGSELRAMRSEKLAKGVPKGAEAIF